MSGCFRTGASRRRPTAVRPAVVAGRTWRFPSPTAPNWRHSSPKRPTGRARCGPRTAVCAESGGDGRSGAVAHIGPTDVRCGPSTPGAPVAGADLRWDLQPAGPDRGYRAVDLVGRAAGHPLVSDVELLALETGQPSDVP